MQEIIVCIQVEDTDAAIVGALITQCLQRYIVALRINGVTINIKDDKEEGTWTFPPPDDTN